MKKLQSGFTLIEIAIVLVIIGLLLGGVLKGQEMITNSKVRNTISSLDGIAAAVYSYQDRYQAWPGDDPNANARWGAAAPDGDGDGVVDGAWEAINATTAESAAVWQHLRLAGLITGSPSAAADLATMVLPNHAFNGIFGIEDVNGTGSTTNTNFPTGPMVCMSNVEAEIGEILDRNLDDGDGIQGDVQNVTGVGGGTAGDQIYDVPNGDIYTVCRRL